MSRQRLIDMAIGAVAGAAAAALALWVADICCGVMSDLLTACGEPAGPYGPRGQK